MVEYISHVDDIFAALADPIRRDIIVRTTEKELTVNQIAIEYDMSLAAVSKHIRVLLAVELITKRRSGRYQLVRATSQSLDEAIEYLEQLKKRANGLTMERDVFNSYEAKTQ